MYIDLTSSKQTSAGGSKYWCLAVDEATHMKFSMFLKQKSDMKEKLVPFLKELHHTYGVKIKHIRCDNAGENRALEDLCIEKDLGIVSTRNTTTKWSSRKGICDNVGKNKGYYEWGRIRRKEKAFVLDRSRQYSNTFGKFYY